MRIEIFGIPMCDLCEAACNIADQYGAYYQYTNLQQLSSDEVTYIINERAGGTTKAPIIFIDGRFINDINTFRSFFESRINQEESTVRMGGDSIHQEGRLVSHPKRDDEF